jgi:hypothetical protein
LPLGEGPAILYLQRLESITVSMRTRCSIDLLNAIEEASVNFHLLLFAAQLGILLSPVALLARPASTLAKKAATRR